MSATKNETAIETKTTKGHAAKKPAKTKSVTPDATTADAATTKTENAPKEDLVVFAIRLTEPERKAIHDAAGPRNATQFVRAVALAAARDDLAAFKYAINEAKKLRA